LRRDVRVVTAGAVLAAAATLGSLYIGLPGKTWSLAAAVAAVVALGGVVAYLLHRPTAARVVFPASRRGT
jgi:hypothetical protein